MGPATGRVRVTECKNLTLTSPTRSLIISDSRGVLVHTLVPQRPLLTGARTTSITLAPLNIHYGKLRNQLAAAGLQTHLNLWNKPLHLGADGSVITGACEVISPDEFHLHAMPFSDSSSPVDGRPPLVPPGLPRKFIKSIETARHRVSSFRNEVEDSELNSEQKVILQKAIDARFKKWLKETGKQRELDQLEKLSVSLKYSRISKQTTI